MTYTIYFEIYGKKMKVKIDAKNIDAAKESVRAKIIFYKIETIEDELFGNLSSIFFGKK